jgi:hypothetical protein
LPEIRANKGAPFISHALDNKEDEIKEEEGKDALFIEEDKQEECDSSGSRSAT